MNLNDKKYGIFMLVARGTLLSPPRWEKIDEIEYKDIDWRMDLVRKGNPDRQFKVEELPEATEFTMANEDKEVNGKSLKELIAEMKKIQPKIVPDNIPFILDLFPGLLPSDLDKKNDEGFSHLVRQLKALTEKGLENPDKEVFGGLGDLVKNWPTMPKSEEFKGFMPGLISDLGWITSKDNPFRLAVDKETDNDPSKLTINVRKVRKPDSANLNELSPEEKKERKAIEAMMEWDKERLAKHGRTWEEQARKHSQKAHRLEQKNAQLLENMEEMFQELKHYKMVEAEENVENELRATFFVEPSED
ncbi:hypothetical protein [Bacillus phage YungSlug]|nr:hypothetical protein [Bacillus phage YungSlug]